MYVQEHTVSEMVFHWFLFYHQQENLCHVAV